MWRRRFWPTINSDWTTNVTTQRVIVSPCAISKILIGDDKVDDGYNTLLAIRQRQVKEYVQRVRVAGFGERFENGRANPMLEQ